MAKQVAVAAIAAMTGTITVRVFTITSRGENQRCWKGAANAPNPPPCARGGRLHDARIARLRATTRPDCLANPGFRSRVSRHATGNEPGFRTRRV